MKIVILRNKYYTSMATETLFGRLAKAFQSLAVEVEIVCNDAYSVGTGRYPDCDAVVFWDKDVLLAKAFETHGLLVINNSAAIEVCDDKAKTFIALQAAGISTPDTIVAPFCFANIGYTDLDFLQSAVASLGGYPLIIKPRTGSLGMGVKLVGNKEEAIAAIIESASVGGSILQSFVSESRGRDVRLTVVGGKIVCAIERINSNGDFRANIAGGGRGYTYVPTEAEEKLCLAAASAIGLDYGGIDLLHTVEGPTILEINSNAFFLESEKVTNVDIAKCYAKYVLDKVEAHVGKV